MEQASEKQCVEVLDAVVDRKNNFNFNFTFTTGEHDWHGKSRYDTYYMSIFSFPISFYFTALTHAIMKPYQNQHARTPPYPNHVRTVSRPKHQAIPWHILCAQYHQVTASPPTNQVKLNIVIILMPSTVFKAIRSISLNAPLHVAHWNAGSETAGCRVYIPNVYCS